MRAAREGRSPLLSSLPNGEKRRRGLVNFHRGCLNNRVENKFPFFCLPVILVSAASLFYLGQSVALDTLSRLGNIKEGRGENARWMHICIRRGGGYKSDLRQGRRR